MMNVATIGSGVIVERMIEAMRLDGRYNLYCVYSRTEKRAKEFAEKHGIQKYYTDMEEMLNDENVDIVYVASPNSLHYSQSKMALEHEKHVINEKPFTPTLKECNELFEIAEKKGVYIFEAITNVHLPNYKIIKENMSNCGNIKMVQCNFSQYSSKYQKYKDHVQTNAFDTAFNGGALMDINVYNLRFRRTEFGFIKSRHIDDKAMVAAVIDVLRQLKEENLTPAYDTLFAFPIYEEIGHGGAYVPSEVSEYVALDIGLIGPDNHGFVPYTLYKLLHPYLG